MSQFTWLPFFEEITSREIRPHFRACFRPAGMTQFASFCRLQGKGYSHNFNDISVLQQFSSSVS